MPLSTDDPRRSSTVSLLSTLLAGYRGWAAGGAVSLVLGHPRANVGDLRDVYATVVTLERWLDATRAGVPLERIPGACERAQALVAELRYDALLASDRVATLLEARVAPDARHAVVSLVSALARVARTEREGLARSAVLGERKQRDAARAHRASSERRAADACDVAAGLVDRLLRSPALRDEEHAVLLARAGSIPFELRSCAFDLSRALAAARDLAPHSEARATAGADVVAARSSRPFALSRAPRVDRIASSFGRLA